ncbi:MAG: arsenate reductase family protein [Acidobacteriota bacterium]|nr:arsenate reductase family protein [Acidobacteriota bacterium]
MLKQKAELELRDLGKQPLTESELETLIGNRDYLLFLNPKNELYRSRNMKSKPPSRPEAIKLMAQNPNLIRRPIVVAEKKIVIGYDEEALKGLS